MAKLDDLGYPHVPMVEEHGDASRRGGIVDFFTFGRTHPVRIEFDGDVIASIREFEIASQRSVTKLDRVSVLPTRELKLTQAELEERRAEIASRHPKGEAGADLLIEDLATRRDVEGGHWLAGLFRDRLGDLFDYFPSGTLVVVDGPKRLLDDLTALESDVRQAYAAELAKGHFHALPEETFVFRDEFLERIAACHQLVLPGPGDSPGRAIGKPAMRVALRTLPSEGFGRNMNLLRESLARHREAGREVRILCESEPHAARLREILDDWELAVTLGSLGEGFSLVDSSLTLITDHEIWGRPRRRRERSRRFEKGLVASDLQELKQGDYVVHIEHGIGVYQGLERLSLDGRETDCLLIRYAKGDKLFVPVEQLALVQRYSAGEGAVPSVSTIGGTAWQKLKSRVKSRIKMMAEELIQTYSKRKALPGHAFSPDTVWQREMESAFPYDETPDQAKAIEDVKRDMEAPRPMDRLVCGDVGFGKTEVAIRAAFKAVMDGKQVAVLVPTTLLAEQHLETFSERMKGFPVRVEMMSRFRSAAELKVIAKDLAEGKLDIVIGTHRLLSKDVNFKDLGLLVIDEEQRFGVRHKEVFKKLRSQVDVLTLSATPIPRTLHMSLLGSSDMSMINTAPRDRQPVHTEVVLFSSDLITEALLREADRGGQSFFVHNRVETIHEMGIFLHKLVPELRIGIAHGQMQEKLIERVMLDFVHRQHDVLLTTMIIESGLDIPTVNTILINRADAFGLAQLYQLRGRVGRSTRKAHAYLLVPPDRALTETAQKRLRVIDELTELGSGLQLAMRDLEIRGAGNLLGAEQSGFIVNVGFDLYCRLLDEAVRELNGLPPEDLTDLQLTTDLNAYLPDEYVADRTLKLRLYKRLAEADSPDRIVEIETELRDRFGPLPAEAACLVDLRRLRLLAARLGMSTMILRKGYFEATFAREMKTDEVRALLKATTVPIEFSASGQHGFRISRFRDGGVAEAIRLVRAIGASNADGAGDPFSA
jgi:transcription-repair coupling factor (superfamily II helicase)